MELLAPAGSASKRRETNENPDDDGRVERSGDRPLRRDQLRNERSGLGWPRLRPDTEFNLKPRRR